MKTKHALATRIYHWVNVPVLAIMIWSGILIYWANDEYTLTLFGVKLFHFFPKPVYAALNAPFHLAQGMAWHFTFMWLFFLNGLFYVIHSIYSGAWRELFPNRHSFREAIQVTLYDLKLSKKHPPQGKFNAAQRLAYTGIILMGFGSIVTGLAIYKPVQFNWITFLCGGYEWARLEHFVLTLGYVFFFLIHIAQVIRAGWNNFQSMITGVERSDSNRKGYTGRAITSFFFYSAFIACCWMGIGHINGQEKVDGIPASLRSTLKFNQQVFQAFFSEERQSKEFDTADAARRVRKNGLIGMKDFFADTNYRLVVLRNQTDTLRISLGELKALPKTEVVFDFKCIEGWSQVTRWSGVRFSVFANQYHLATKSGKQVQPEPDDDWYKYTGLETPDKKYFVGIDMQSMMHPQTILCYEMNGKPLPNLDGAPLRLIIPVKYGVKHIKRIGKIYFSDTPPPDYWAKSGYDYYAGL